MPIIYHVTIEATETENLFRIHWANKENTVHTFKQSASHIMPEEMEWMWKDQRNQLKIGEKLSRFLDGNDHHLQRALKDAENHAETLQLHLTLCRETSNWPFELLALKDSFLLPNRVHLVRLVPVQEPLKESPPQNRRLRLLFMACCPLDVQSELDFEQEEEGIFKAAEKLAIDMEVEDTGSLEGLREKLEHSQYDIVHLSGYAGIDKKGQPFLVMESETGYREEVPVEKLWQEGLKVNPPRLLFISGSSTGDAPGETENVLARILVEKYHVPAVLGWGQWISDNEANEAASMIYKELSRGETLLHAVQRARYKLFNNYPSVLKPSWPQLRLFSSGGSLDAIVEKEQKEQPQVRRMTHVYLRNSDVKVLGEGFVGRRRQLQQSIHILKQDREKVGVLMLGTGGLGKSCLAGKVSERFKEHTLISVHGRLNSITLKRALKDAFVVSQDEHGKEVLSWEMEMKDIVGVLSRSCFKDKKYLILLDDFEQNLEGSEKGEPGGLLPEAMELLKALLDGLPDNEKMTRMIMTSRYVFSLMEEVHNLVKERLELIWLAGFREVEQKKKVRALAHISKQKDPIHVEKLLAAGCGNPRLMEWIDVLVGEMDKTKTGIAELLEAVSGKKQEFIQKHVINELLELGGEELTIFLRWFAIYRRPVLKEGAKEVGEKAGLKEWEELLYRGMDLSLVEHDRARWSYRGTPLLRDEFLSKLDDHRGCHEAAFVYYKSICEGKADEPFDPVQVEEWIFHALGCGEEDVVSNQGGILMAYLRERLAYLEASRVGKWILVGKKRDISTIDDSFFLNEFAFTLNDLGEHRQAVEYFEQSLSINRTIYGEQHEEVATRLNNLGSAWDALGDYHRAAEYFQQALDILENIYGNSHTNVAGALNNLGLECDALGEYKKAIDYYNRALIIWKNIYGDTHPKVSYALSNLGATWKVLGDYKKAVECFLEAIKINIDVYGEDHPNVGKNLNNLGDTWRALGQPQKAIDYFRQALTIDLKVFGKMHRKISRGLNNLGAALQESGEYRKAVEYFQQALSIDQALYGEESSYVAIELNNLGWAWKALGNPKKALFYYNKALTSLKSIYGEVHPLCATVLNNIGEAWETLDDHRNAVDFYNRALNNFKSIYGENHSDIASVLINLGAAWNRSGEMNKAIDYFNQAQTILANVYGGEHPIVATALNNLGSTYFQNGQSERSKGYFEQAYEIFNKFFGPEHPNTKKTAAWLEELGVSCKNQG